MEGFTEVPVNKVGGALTRVPPGKVPAGAAIDARNCRFNGDTANIRPGKTLAFQSTDQHDRVVSFHQFKAQDGEFINAYFTSKGYLERENVNGNGVTSRVNPAALFTAQQNVFATMADAYNRLYMAFSNGLASQTSPSAAPQQYYKDVNGLMHMDAIGLVPNQIPPTGAASTANAGTIQIGQRNCVVLARTRTGYIAGASSAAIITFNITTAGFTVKISGLPIFPQANVVDRVVAFTPAGGSTGGPWFWILSDVTVDGVLQKSTVVPNNEVTDYEFTFSDEYLFALVDQTNFIFDVQQFPNDAFVYYSKNLKRLIMWGDESSTIRVSEIDLPEVNRVSQGFVQVGFGDRQNVVGVLDTKTETIIFKDNSGFVIADSSNAPNLWAVPRKWEGSGPCGPRAYDTCNAFTAFASKAGLHVYLGDVPEYVAWSNHGTKDAYWSRINWDYASLIWLRIDEDRKEIHIGVPIDNDVVPSKDICIDYSRGWKDTRWSFDDCWAHSMHKVKRTPPVPANANDVVDQSLKLWQMLFTSSFADGTVQLQDPSRQDDNGQGIDQFYQSAFLSLKPSKINGVYRLGGVDVVANGLGKLATLIYPVRSGNKPAEPFPVTTEKRAIDLHGETEVFHRNFDGRNASWFSISFSNNKQPGNWFEVHSYSMWMNLAWENRP